MNNLPQGLSPAFEGDIGLEVVAVHPHISLAPRSLEDPNANLLAETQRNPVVMIVLHNWRRRGDAAFHAVIRQGQAGEA